MATSVSVSDFSVEDRTRIVIALQLKMASLERSRKGVDPEMDVLICKSISIYNSLVSKFR